MKRNRCSLIGIPDHQGVVHVGGRLGAARGPEAFREIFKKMKGREAIHDRVDDLGDVKGLSDDIQSNHRRAADLVREGQHPNRFSVVVGGGHDHGYSHLLGVKEALQALKKNPRLGCINIDAHLDVRQPAPLVTSGSPFYLALESKVLDPKRFVEFGIQSHCNGPDLWKYTDRKKVKVVGMESLRGGRAIPLFRSTLMKLSQNCDAIVISLDLDAASAAFAPGVSAPQAEGFTSSEVIQMIEIAAIHPKTVSLGIFELNPEHDRDNQTARLAATAAYHFMEKGMQRSCPPDFLNKT